MSEIALTEFDRSLIVGLTEANLRLARALEEQRGERVYKIDEAAEILGVSVRTISRYLRQGAIKRGVRGGRSGIPQSEIDKVKRAIAKQKSKPMKKG